MKLLRRALSHVFYKPADLLYSIGNLVRNGRRKPSTFPAWWSYTLYVRGPETQLDRLIHHLIRWSEDEQMSLQLFASEMKEREIKKGWRPLDNTSYAASNGTVEAYERRGSND